MRALISVSGGLGDMIMHLPLFTKFPGSLILSDIYKELFSPYQLDIIWWKENKSVTENILKISLELWKRNYEFVYGTYPNGRRTNLLLALSPGKKFFYDDGNFSLRRLLWLTKVSPGIVRIPIKYPPLRKYTELNSNLIGIPPDKNFDFKEFSEFSEEAEEKVPYAIIHPTSKYKTKRWDLYKFIEIAKKIVANGLKTIFVLSKDDKEEFKILEYELSKEKADKSIDFLFGESINKIISYIKRAKIFLGNDSALAHIAGISKIKTFVIFGYTRYYHTAPEGAEIIRLELPCSPCYNFAKGEKSVEKECKLGIACLKNITPDMVWERISKYI